MTVVVEGLTKTFKGKKAVDDLYFELRPGRVTGFLGPNGAGKSTTMRLMLGLDRPDSGRVLFDGRPYADVPEPARAVGALLDANTFDGGRTPRNHLRMLAAYAGIAESRVGEVLGLVGMSTVADRRVKGFSLGMHQRLGVAQAMLGDPEFLFLDEPTNGLDPEGIHWVRETLRRMADNGRGVFVSSHLLSELHQFVDHLVVIGKGKLIADAPVEEITSHGRTTITVRSPQAKRLGELLVARGAALAWRGEDQFDAENVTAEAIGDLAALEQIPLHELHTERASLEEAFLSLTSDEQEFETGGRP